MLIVHERCCGVQARTDGMIACALLPSGKEVRSFAVSAACLSDLADWLVLSGVSIVAADGAQAQLSALRQALEPRAIRLVRLDGRDVRRLPGRPADILDAEWYAQLLHHGLLDEHEVARRRRSRLTGVLTGVLLVQLGLVGWSLALGLRPSYTEASFQGQAPARVPPPPPGRPGVPATAVPAPVVPAPPPKIVERPDPGFSRLLTHDVVLGLLVLERDGPQTLRLTNPQKQCLRAIAPRVVEWMRREARMYGPLDEEIRECLSEAQLEFINQRFDPSRVPPTLGPGAAAFEKMLTP